MVWEDSVPERALRLAGKIAVVTGGGRGLGRAIALALGREGADVALSYRSSGSGAQAVADALAAAGRRAHLGQADAGKPGEIGRFVDDAATALGGIDVLVNNSASSGASPSTRSPTTRWTKPSP